MNPKFDNLIVLGRPACGKSEFIDFIKNMSDGDRAKNYHIGSFEEVDDFPWIWEKFLEDDIWEAAGYPRLYSFSDDENSGLCEKGGVLFDYCIEKFNREMVKKYLGSPDFYKSKTLLVEFSRGGDDGYKNAFTRLSEKVLERAAVLYIKVSRDESWRRNVKRYEERLKSSILAHMVPKKTFDIYYRADDWEVFTGGAEFGLLNIHDLKIPFVTMNNEPELPPGQEIAERYKKALDKLWKIYVE